MRSSSFFYPSYCTMFRAGDRDLDRSVSNWNLRSASEGLRFWSRGWPGLGIESRSCNILICLKWVQQWPLINVDLFTNYVPKFHILTVSGVAKGGPGGARAPPGKTCAPRVPPIWDFCICHCICHYLVVPPHQTAVPPLCPPRIKSLVMPLLTVYCTANVELVVV